MKMIMQRLLTVLGAMGILMGSSQVFAQLEEGRTEFSLYLPYLHTQDLDFDGGAKADIDDGFGFGFSTAYNMTDKLAFRGDLHWIEVDWSGERVFDAALPNQHIDGDYDIVDTHFGLDYYFAEWGDFKPFVNGNLGWAFVDTNIAEGPPVNVCWWDPWWGYVCSWFQETREETVFHYGLGGGVRYDLNRRQYLRLGYYLDWQDVDNGGTVDVGQFRFEFGVSY